MRKTCAVTIVVLSLSFLFLGCGKDESPIAPPAPPPSVSGQWSGARSGVVYSFTLSQSGSNITGSGTLSNDVESVAVSVDGTCVYPNVSLTIWAPGYSDMNFTGSFINKNTLDGELNGSGAYDEPIRFVRK